MKWYFIDSGFLAGEQNMNFDLELAKNCLPQEAFFRLYRWKPFTISLGKNQSFEEIDLSKAKADGLEVVKRPTGGRAILHAEEITYAAVVGENFGLSPKNLYRKISDALLIGLNFYDPSLKPAELESVQPNFADELNKQSGGICFASTAKNEVKFEGKKIIGSAQRKLNNTILQHGSVLCGTMHRKLPEYFNLDNTTIKNLTHEMLARTTELETILNKPTDYALLKDSLLKGFETEFDIKMNIKKNVESYV